MARASQGHDRKDVTEPRIDYYMPGEAIILKDGDPWVRTKLEGK